MPAIDNNLGHRLLARAHSPTATDRIFTEKVQLRPLLLRASEPATTTPDARTYRRNARLAAVAKRKKAVKPRPLSAREKKAIGVHEVPIEERKYAIYAPLHQLWLGYMAEILGTQGENFKEATTASVAILCSADFHGALLEVVRSRCPSRVGVKGIVVRDTKYTFELITTKNELKIMPKEHTVFRFELQVERPSAAQTASESEKEQRVLPQPRRMIFEVHGDQFQHRAVDRANKKHKPHWLPNI